MFSAHDVSISVETYLSRGGRWHTKADCKRTRQNGGPKNCVIHKPSEHKLMGSPMVLRGSGLIERICRHGIGHYDPDSAAWFEFVNPQGGAHSIHGCDGCCGPLVLRTDPAPDWEE